MKGGAFYSLLMFIFVGSNQVSADPVTQVFECNINGQRVFSDHACGDDAVQRDVAVANRMDAVKVTGNKSSEANSSRPSRRPAAGNDEHDKRRQQCARIQKSREALMDKMRAGYTARQDERLHTRLRKLNDDYFELRCSSVR